MQGSSINEPVRFPQLYDLPGCRLLQQAPAKYSSRPPPYASGDRHPAIMTIVTPVCCNNVKTALAGKKSRSRATSFPAPGQPVAWSSEERVLRFAQSLRYFGNSNLN